MARDVTTESILSGVKRSQILINRVKTTEIKKLMKLGLYLLKIF